MSTSRTAGLAAATCIAITLAWGCGSSSEPNQGDQGPGTSHDAGTGDSPSSANDAPTTLPSSDAAEDTSQGTETDAETDQGATPEPDAGSREAGPDTSVETITVPGAGTPVTFKTSLVQGAVYLLRATGSVDVGGQKEDAEFTFAPNGTGEADKVNTVDVGIDVGLLELHAMNHTTIVPPGPGRMKWYGAFRADHTYFMWVTGEGKPLTLKLLTSGAAGAGGIGVSLYELGPAPPAVYTIMTAPVPPPPAPPKIGRDPLDTIQVPLTKTIVHAKFVTEQNVIYLLQASGVAQVSKGAITPDHNHMGDAQYMDWPATGTKFNDGECGAEFGIGVDETVGPDPCTGGNVYKHRLNWWGPYRNDHIYYMLFAGTGKVIDFLYYDSGYGDNSMTDTVTVRIFAAP
jgi:hypothetical protein